MTRFLTFLAALLFAGAVHAQSYPTRASDGVNDFARIIDDETESRIAEKLATFASDHDTEVTIVTLSSLRFYAQDSTIDDYATGLFNDWAIGDADANTGILLIVFRDDRELRVEYGSGYNEDIQKQIDRVVDEDILPSFRTQDYAAGLESGVDGLLTRVISPRRPTPARHQIKRPKAKAAAIRFIMCWAESSRPLPVWLG